MSTIQYEKPSPARFAIKRVDGADEIIIPAQRNWFVMSFLTVWLAGWTFGGVAAFAELVTKPEPFLAIWLVGWAFGEFFAAATIAWSLNGHEFLRPELDGLAYGYRLFGIKKSRLYQRAEIRDLRAASAVNPLTMFRMEWLPIAGHQFGSVKFDYGARTVNMAPSLDEAEAKLVVAEIKRRMPSLA